MARYLTPPKSLKEADKTFIQDAIEVLETEFKGDLFGESNRPLTETYTTSDGLYHWTNKDFLTYITDLTNTDDIRSASNVLYQTVTKAPEFVTTMSPPPKYAVESNTLTPEQLKTFVKEAEEKEVLRQEVTSEAEKTVREALKRKQEIWTKLEQQKLPKVATKDIQGKVLAELKDKVLYAVPNNKQPEITLTKNEQILVKIAKTDPKLFVDKLSELIIERNPDIPADTLQSLSRVVAVDTEKILTNQLDKPIPTGVFLAVSNTPDVINGLSPITQAELAKTSSILTVFSQNKENIYRTLLVRSVGENLANKVLGFPEMTYSLSGSPSDGSYSLKADQLQSTSFSLQEGSISNIFNNPVFSEAKSLAGGELKNLALSKVQSLPNRGFFGTISRFTNSRSFDSIAPFLGLPTNATYIGTNFFGKAITTLLPDYAPLMSNLAGKMGVDLGIRAVAPVVVEKTAEAAITATGGKIAGGLISKVATFLGGLGSWATFGLSIVAGYIVGKIIEKIPWKKITPFLVGGAVLLIAGPVAGVAVGIGSFALINGGIRGLTLGRIGNGFVSFFGALGVAFWGAIGMPILVTLLVFPVVVALILFIINSGAYIVPARTSGYPVGCTPQSTQIVDKASAIAGNLKLGFNSYYNNSPDFPELWNATLFAQNPNPKNQEDSIGADDMFWCNYMATKSFEAGNEIIPFSLPTMISYFQNQQGKWINGPPATYNDVCPGDAVFFYNSFDPAGSISHVGVVASVSSDGITTFESNAPYKPGWSYPTDSSGHFQTIPIGQGKSINIIGFGRP